MPAASLFDDEIRIGHDTADQRVIAPLW
jgi:hypothetical protein